MVTRFLWRRRWDSNPRGAHHAKTISSRSRYDHFDTSPYMSARRFFLPFSDEKGLWKELTERTANYSVFRTVENPHGYKVLAGRNGQLPARFRVSPVMPCCGARKNRRAFAFLDFFDRGHSFLLPSSAAGSGRKRPHFDTSPYI